MSIQGWLHKESPKKIMGRGALQKRYFVLHTESPEYPELLYYKTPNGEQVGAILLHGATVRRGETTRGIEVVEAASDRCFKLKAETWEEASQWVAVLTAAVHSAEEVPNAAMSGKEAAVASARGADAGGSQRDDAYRAARNGNKGMSPGSFRSSRSSKAESEAAVYAAVAAASKAAKAAQVHADAPSQSSAPLPRPSQAVFSPTTHSGWLWRPPPVATGQWKRKWCELRGTTLYQVEKSVARPFVDVAGLLCQPIVPGPVHTPSPLPSVLLLRADGEPLGAEHVRTAKPSKAELKEASLTLAAETQADADLWQQALQVCARMHALTLTPGPGSRMPSGEGAWAVNTHRSLDERGPSPKLHIRHAWGVGAALTASSPPPRPLSARVPRRRAAAWPSSTRPSAI